jgi:hypothetical protein
MSLRSAPDRAIKQRMVGAAFFMPRFQNSWRWTRTTLLAFALPSLAACAGTSPPQSVVSPVQTAPAQAAPALTPAPAVAALPMPAPVPPARAPNDPRQLVGIKGESLIEWLGETVFVRRDGTAEIWRFAAETCFLDVFLYREPDGLRVAHVDARPRSGTQRVTAQTCYTRIMAARPRGTS